MAPDEHSGEILFAELNSMAILEFILSIESHYDIKLDLTAFLGEGKLETIGELSSHIEKMLEAQQQAS